LVWFVPFIIPSIRQGNLTYVLDLAQDHQELGAALNGFSLNERGSGEQQGHLSAALEKAGQANDTTSTSTTKLIQDLEQNWVEPVHEYSQFASIIKKLLVYRHQKQVQYEMTQDALVAKQEQLEELEKSEREARRLEEALGRGRVRRSSSMSGRAAPEGGGTRMDRRRNKTILHNSRCPVFRLTRTPVLFEGEHPGWASSVPSATLCPA